MDPFCGKGTVLLEACLLGRKAVGFDVALDAIIATNAKADPPQHDKLLEFLNSLNGADRKTRKVPWQVNVFFSRKTISQILAVRDRLLAELSHGRKDRQRAANFLLGVLLGLLHGHSKLSLSLPCSHSFGMAPKYVRGYAKRSRLRRPYRDVKQCLISRSEELLKEGLPPVRGRAFLCGAEEYKFVGGPDLTNSVDLIVTSPPYLNVQTYAKDSWLRLWLLGCDYKKIKQRFLETGSPTIYLQRITPCLREMLRVLKPSRYAVIIAGDAPFVKKGKKQCFETAEELGHLATRLVHAGFTFKIQNKIVDEIPAHARYYAAVHKDGGKNNGVKRKGVIVERIVVLKKVKVGSNKVHPSALLDRPMEQGRNLDLPQSLQKVESLFRKWSGLY